MNYRKNLSASVKKYVTREACPDVYKAYSYGKAKIERLVTIAKSFNREALLEAKEIFENNYFSESNFERAISVAKEMIRADDIKERIYLTEGVYLVYLPENKMIKSLKLCIGPTDIPDSRSIYVREMALSVNILRSELQLTLEDCISKMFH